MSDLNRLYPRHAEAVTPSDSVVHNYIALWVGGAGTVALKLAGDTVAVNFVAVPAGSFLPVQTMYVMSTGTTATNIVGLRAN